MSYRIGSASMAAVLAAAAAFLPSSALAAPAIAPPSTVACGATITHSVTLAGDVDCPSGFTGAALTVAAGDLTIDLNGHTITVPQTSNSSNATGILDVGHPDVHVIDGAIDNFTYAVQLRRASGSSIDQLTTTPGLGGDAILIQGGTDLLVTNSNIEYGDGVGIDVVDAPATVIRDTFSEVSLGAGIAFNSNHDTAFHDQTFAETSSLLVAGSHNRLIDDSSAVAIGSGDGNLVRGGASSNGSASASAGYEVDAAATNTTIESVRADHTFGSGIDVLSPSTTLLDNTADDNFGYGIDAVPGVTSRGNEASGNGAEPQCLNVTCSS